MSFVTSHGFVVSAGQSCIAIPSSEHVGDGRFIPSAGYKSSADPSGRIRGPGF